MSLQQAIHPAGCHAGLATGKRGTKRTARDSLATETLPLKKRLDLNRAAATDADAADDADGDGESAEEGAEMALVRMRCARFACAAASLSLSRSVMQRNWLSCTTLSHTRGDHEVVSCMTDSGY